MTGVNSWSVALRVNDPVAHAEDHVNRCRPDVRQRLHVSNCQDCFQTPKGIPNAHTLQACLGADESYRYKGMIFTSTLPELIATIKPKHSASSAYGQNPSETPHQHPRCHAAKTHLADELASKGFEAARCRKILRNNPHTHLQVVLHTTTAPQSQSHAGHDRTYISCCDCRESSARWFAIGS